MSSFTTTLIVRPLEKDELKTLKWRDGWEVERGFSYDLGRRGGGDKITIRKGFKTNFASVPRFLWWMFPPYHPDYGKAAVIHDYLWGLQEYSKRYCDAVFYDAMICLGCSPSKAEALYQAVNLCGGKAWKSCQVQARTKNPEIKLPYPVLI